MQRTKQGGDVELASHRRVNDNWLLTEVRKGQRMGHCFGITARRLWTLWSHTTSSTNIILIHSPAPLRDTLLLIPHDRYPVLSHALLRR